MMAKIKVAFAQINYKPSCFYDNNDLLIEPFGDETTSISKLSYNGSEKIRNELKTNYCNWIRKKIITIVKKAMELNIRLLVFPEYSIPAVILCDIITVIKNSSIIIVSGTHVVTNNTINLPDGYPDYKTIIGCAMCPILSSEGFISYTLKTHKASVETNNLKLPKTKSPSDTISFGNFDLQIKICIDAITGGDSLLYANKKIVAITSMSQKIEPFQALAILSKYNGIPIIYANNANIGGSMISGAFLQDNSQWFVSGFSTKPVQKNIECLVSAIIDIDNIDHVVGTVHINPSITVDNVVNIFYRTDDKDKVIIDAIEQYLEKFEISLLLNKDIIPDALFAEKLRYIELESRNGLLSEENAVHILENIKMNLSTFEQFKMDQANFVLSKLSGNFYNGINDQFFIKSIATISEFISNQHGSHQSVESELFNDESLFQGRDKEVAELANFFDGEKSVLLIHGIKGIGKTKLISNISSNVLPSTTPWEIKYLAIDKGIGYEYFLDQIEFVLNLHYVEKTNTAPNIIVEKYFDEINKNNYILLILDDIHNYTDATGIFSDSQSRQFLLSFINKSLTSERFKLIMTSNRRIDEFDKQNIDLIEISKLSDKVIRFIIGYCYKKITNSTKSPYVQDSVINLVYGNPLAAIIVAQLIGDNKLDEFEDKGNVFQRFQERQMKNLIDEVILSNDEIQLMEILAVSKGSIHINFILSNYSYLLHAIDSLVNRFLLEKANDIVKIHPLFKDFYYDKLEISKRVTYHSKFAAYYEKEYSRKNAKTNPLVLSNIIYHLAGSLQIEKLNGYKFRYIDEVKPIADRLYNDKNYEEAVKYYHMVYEVSKELRHDVLIRMAQCYIYCDDIINADEFFKLATKANPRGAYLWAQYSIALSSQRKYHQFALKRAKEAQEVFTRNGSHLNWEHAKIKFALAKAYGYDNIPFSLSLYKEACSLDPTNIYYICMYAKTLFYNGNNAEAKIQLHRAEIIQRDYDLLLRLKQKYAKLMDVENTDQDSNIDLDFEDKDKDDDENDDDDEKND